MKGCKANIDQWKVASGISPSDTVEMFQAPAHSERGHSESTMLTASSGAKCTGCCFSTTSNALLKPEDDVSVLDKSQRDAYALSSENGVCVQNPDLGAECTGSKIMFYWMNGYGKFLNMGLTAIYANYLGAFLTVPNQPWSATDPSKGPFLRRSADQLQGMGMSAGASQQYDMFTSGDSTLSDKRPYLTGYCTTFQYGSPFQSASLYLDGTHPSLVKSCRTSTTLKQPRKTTTRISSSLLVEWYTLKNGGPMCFRIRHSRHRRLEEREGGP